MEPGKAKRFDSEYERKGTAHVLMAFEPLKGYRKAKVTEHRRKVEFAEMMRHLADDLYPNADRIRLVVDNLNTHTAAAFYESFPPEQARRLAKKIEFVYTPVHGSWLNMVEIELSVLVRQCLNGTHPGHRDSRVGSGSLVRGAKLAGYQRRLALLHRRWPHKAAQALSIN
jgi:hypothetical protein